MENSYTKYRENSDEDSDDLFENDSSESSTDKSQSLVSVDETLNSSSYRETADSPDDSEDDNDSFAKVKIRRRKPINFSDSEPDEESGSEENSAGSSGSPSSKIKTRVVYKTPLDASDPIVSVIPEEEAQQKIAEKIENNNVISDPIVSAATPEEETQQKLAENIEDKNVVSDEDANSSSVEILADRLSAPILLSSDDESSKKSTQNFAPSTISSTPNKILIQSKINSMLQSPKLGQFTKRIPCTFAEKENQRQKVVGIQTNLRQTMNILKTLNLNDLPDRGELLRKRAKSLEEELQKEQEKLDSMVPEQGASGPNVPSWRSLQVLSNQVQPAGFGGKQAMETYQTQKALTMDKLKILHQSLQTRPKEDAVVEDPKGLKVELMRHQKQALAFLLWREGQKPSGGILADDMGLGKTLTMISLILKSREMQLSDKEETDSDDSDAENKEESEWKNKRSREYYPGGTLVVCPASLVEQWANEIKKHCRRDILDVELYHGPNRQMRSRKLAKHDVVITTYNLVGRERECNDRLFGVRWKRIILDEAHVVRNHKSQSSLGVCTLKGQHRWCLTGTPVHNKEIDLFALLKFLRCRPFDDLAIWRKWIDNKSAGGQERLDTIIQSIMLRRTKVVLQESGTFSLPDKQMEIINVTLNKEETKIYQKILIFSKTLFAQFLHQRAEKNVDLMYSKQNDVQFLNSNTNSEYEKIHRHLLKMNGGQTVKAHQILVLLLRLRQICCHPSLIRTMLENEACAAEGINDSDGSDIDLLEQLENLNINDDNPAPTEAPEGEESVEKLGAAASKIIDYKSEIFNTSSLSSKTKIVIETLREKVIKSGDKAIIVSQWTSMLKIIEQHLKNNGIQCVTLSGEVPVPKRMEMVDSFNRSSSPVKVMLLSLTAGGVGLNLVGANHLLLIDLHWNPQLEAQAQDRIYRVGQKKAVNVYKFVTLDTIEERIKALQDNKLTMASNILTGAKQAGGNKLSIEDLKMLFNMA